MDINTSIQKFYDSIEKAHDKLSKDKFEMNERQLKIRDCIKERIQIIAESKEINGISKIKELCTRQINEYNKEISRWSEEVDTYVKSRRFVNQFEESVLLLVFGDVKAGKSALGNFISGYNFIATAYEKFYTNPKLYLYDWSDKLKKGGDKKEITQAYFVEDEIEATATIQYYTLLDGLTWVDTPGIHSLTTENEELAKEYIRYADLVLFLTPSNSPCKQDEGREIERLVKINKPVLITITKSDVTVLEPIDNDFKPVTRAKSLENRCEQEARLADELIYIGGSNILSRNKCISISTKVGRIAIEENDYDMFCQSNLPAFYEQIGNVISEQALELKMKRPHDEVNSVINELQNGNGDKNFVGIGEMIENTLKVLNNIYEYKSMVSEEKNGILQAIKASLAVEIQQCLYYKKINGSLSDARSILESINPIISTVTGIVIADRLGKLLSDFQWHKNIDISIQSEVCLRQNIQKIEYPQQEYKLVTRDPRGLIENIQSLFGKEFREQSLVTKTKSKEMITGDNFNELVAIVWSDINSQLGIIIDKEIACIKDSYFSKLEEILTIVIDTLKKLNDDLNDLKYK